jgi:hypothetical protein
VKKQLAVSMTAAFLLAGAGLPASAQDETITVEGTVFLDRNSNQALDAGEPGHANPLGVYVVDIATQTKVDQDATVNFPLWGQFIEGFSFVDANGDGVKQADEKTHGGRVLLTGTAVDEPPKEIKVEAEVAADGSYHFDLPLGDYTVTAPDLVRDELAIARPLSANDIDWLTGQAKLGERRNTRIDIRYFKPKADAAIEEFAVTPAKDEYTVGDQVDVKVKLTNKGDVPGKLSFVLFRPTGNILSKSNNVVGEKGDFETVAQVLPGESVTVDVKADFTEPEDPKEPNINLGVFARPFVAGHKDVDRSNQGSKFNKRVKVVEKTTTTPTTPTSPSETTTTTTTTTTTPVVTNVSKKSGLASTGASVLGFLGLGSVLLAAGLSAFFVARRRRS